ncbi:MAG: archaemetzincin [Desulfobacterales bacterium]
MEPPGAHSIVISPIGDLESDLIETVAKTVRRLFLFPAQVIPLLGDIEFAFDKSRNQYHSTPILAELAERAPECALKVLALTRFDLFIPILTFVYGEAQLGGRASIVSIARLEESLSPLHPRERFLGRAAKEGAHELAHTFDLRHCKDEGCIMHYCRSIRDVDQKNDTLCRYCKTLLEDKIKQMGVVRRPVP